MQIIRKLLGQSKPTIATAESIFSPPLNSVGVIQDIVVCNVTGTDATFSLFLDNDGTQYNDNTALFKGESISANESIQIEFGNTNDSGLYLNNSDGNLGVKSGSASSTAFTVNGVILRK